MDSAGAPIGRARNLRAKARSGKNLYGIFCDIPSPQIVEMAGLSGFDFAFVDAEHTAASAESVEHMVRAAETRGISAIVRVASHQHAGILRHLDSGADGILVPLVESADQVRSIIDAVKYPPAGKRGLAHVRAANYGIRTALGDYSQRANEETLIAIQVETAEAVRNFESIVAVDDLDAIFFGATDLASSMGLGSAIKMSGSDQPEMIDLIQKLGKIAMAAGKVVGVSAHSPAAYQRWSHAGFRFNATVATLQFGRALTGLLQGCGHNAEL